MSKIIGGSALLLVALLMLVGFLRADVDPSAPATILALLIGVVVPAGAGAALIRAQMRSGGTAARRREELARETRAAEVLRLAGQHGGRLTVVEVVTELAVPPETAKEALDQLMTRDLAEIEVTESGMLVYVFGDVRDLSEKTKSRGLLE
ncbi:MAG: hypothetical protein ACREM1_12890 [Longimicrobiales bacterium]